MKLLDLATERKDLRDARDRLQIELDDPILDLTQFFGAALSACVIDEIEEYLPKTRRDRSHLGIAEPCWNLISCDLNTFADQLAREINVGSVLEIYIDHGEPEIGDRSHLLQSRQAGHGDLDRISHVTLDLFRREALSLGEDLYQRR